MSDDAWSALGQCEDACHPAGVGAALAWYGLWLFTDWMDLATADADEVRAVASVELEAGRRDPYRQRSRVLHLVARRRIAP